MDTKHIIVLVLMLSVVVVLLAGIALMVKGGPLNAKYGNKMMVARVALQGLTLLVLAFFFMGGK